MIAKSNNFHPSTIAFLLVDATHNLLYSNSEAIKVLGYPHQPSKLTGQLLTQFLPSLLTNDNTTQGTETMFGRRQYTINLFPVRNLQKKNIGESYSAIDILSNKVNLADYDLFDFPADEDNLPRAILLERSHTHFVAMSSLAEKFRLSEREIETISYLLDGLTSKQIARKMIISPYTVKTHLRFIMMKMGVSTRSGVVGKLIRVTNRNDSRQQPDLL